MKKIFSNIKFEKDENGNFIMNKKGITLIALVITIVVLIILATLVIGISLGDNGILNRAKQEKEDYLVKANEEQVELAKAGSLQSSRDAATAANPIGTIIAFAAADEPEGYLKCEGQEISRTTYSDLFKVIGTIYGEGDGNTTFNVPDLRGEFLRGAGTNTHSNQGNGGTVGEHQDGTKNAYSYINANNKQLTQLTNNSMSNLESTFDTINLSDCQRLYGGSFTGGDGYGQTYTSRPTNTSVLYCIKY